MVNQPNPATLSDLAAAAHAAAAANGALAAPGGLHPLGSATVWHSGMGAPPGHSLNAAALNNSQAGASTGASASAAGSAQPLPGGKGGAAQVVPANSSVQVTLLHFNDWHVRVEPTKGTWCGLCTQYDVDKGKAASLTMSPTIRVSLLRLVSVNGAGSSSNPHMHLFKIYLSNPLTVLTRHPASCTDDENNTVTVVHHAYHRYDTAPAL
jgi:hypothetical protein